MKFSNPWKRLVAYILDSFILAIPLQVFGYAAVPLYAMVNKDLLAALEASAQSKDGPQTELIISFFYSLIPFLAAAFIVATISYWLYFALMESSSGQATLGKKVFGMIVADDNGQRISFKTASLRFVVKYLCRFCMPLFLPIFFTEKKQTLHDFAASTVVIDKTRA